FVIRIQIPSTHYYTLSLHDALPISDRERASVSDQREDLVQIALHHRAEPPARRMPVLTHGAEEKPDIPGRHVGERVRPIFEDGLDRKSTRLNSSHEWISYAVICLKQ